MFKSALLFVFSFCFIESATSANLSIQFIKIKNQTTNLVVLNQRADAIEIINKELKTPDGNYKNKLLDLKYNILNQFLSLPAQEAFELAAPALLNNRKNSLIHIQKCLALESLNLQCQWLNLKYLRRYSADSFVEQANLYIDQIKDFKQSHLLRYSLYIALDRISEVPSNLKPKTSNPEEALLLKIISYNLAIKTQDYLRAKEAVNYFSEHASDYPDLIFMLYQMSLVWPDKELGVPKSAERQYEVYRKKCADLPASISRKYLYDIDLCTRSIK